MDDLMDMEDVPKRPQATFITFLQDTERNPLAQSRANLSKESSRAVLEERNHGACGLDFLASQAQTVFLDFQNFVFLFYPDLPDAHYPALVSLLRLFVHLMKFQRFEALADYTPLLINSGPFFLRDVPRLGGHKFRNADDWIVRAAESLEESVSGRALFVTNDRDLTDRLVQHHVNVMSSWHFARIFRVVLQTAFEKKIGLLAHTKSLPRTMFWPNLSNSAASLQFTEEDAQWLRSTVLTTAKKQASPQDPNQLKKKNSNNLIINNTNNNNNNNNTTQKIK